MGRSFLLILVLMVSGVSCKKAEELSSRSVASVSNMEGKWNNLSLSVKISNDFDSGEQADIEDAADSWSLNSGTSINFFSDFTNTSDPKYSDINKYQNDGVFGVYKLTSWPKSFNQLALAVTQLTGRVSSRYITLSHADIFVNYDNHEDEHTGSFNFFDSYDLKSVMVHEFGHFLGLLHSESIYDSVMNPSISSYVTYNGPKDFDIQNIQRIYDLAAPPSGGIGAMKAMNSTFDEGEEGEEVVLRIELMADGKCRHFKNGELVNEH